jgi:hypothetical protein
MTTNSAYKLFVDELVELSRVEVTAKRIREYGHSERTNDAHLPLEKIEQQRKEFFLFLLPQQREIIAELLEEAYSGAIHDVASFLEGKLCSDDMRITWKGEDVTSSPYATMHYDFICRRDGDVWPDEELQ